MATVRDRLKKAKDGSAAYQQECAGLLVTSSGCRGQVADHTKRYMSFGEPAISHQSLCAAHALELGYK